ncbi:DUF3857 domain-containing protein [Algibacter amylolyticus]|uniref:DUF3857 domain-containing protein n=1 Tax=Algibacter amylolyticus TaxID=1608400 RepID=A0A5M7BGM9_9FLAO|nr:transglutaminase domain-containing protein [Algibacter amylolyticus]KAA5826315.1 DUF3857 domain-containing protein [Algibacter amylolyticus]MBB5268518.1 transglutaminase-like putative cysteine protease [Algibacter amylolyticus]TSJ80353.1 DUF3857 domain-containing protein [Algibacter amylolyticus]
MRIITILSFLLISGTTFSQDFKFGKVSKEELQEQVNPLDSAANATYLYKNRHTFFQYSQGEGFQQITEVHERIKIYNQEGFEYATKQIRLHVNGGSKEKISGLKGYTYNLISGKVEDFKLTKDGIFDSELNKYVNQIKFTMPKITPGTVIEYKYRIESPFISNVDDFIFQEDIPIKKLEAKFEAPEYFNFKVNTKGYLLIKPIVSSARDKITFVNKSRSDATTTAVRTDYSSSSLEYKINEATYSLSNISALKNEPYVNNMNNYRSSVKYELSYIKFPNSAIEYYSTTWEDVVKKIYESSSFGAELDKKGYYEKDIDALIGSVSDPAKRAALIFNYVKTNMKWNGYYGYYTDNGVRKAYKEQVGNVADINLMLTSMLQHAGLRAYPVLVSTRQNGVPLFPTREGYNYVVSYVKFDDGGVLLDATSEYSVPNVLPFKALNWQGRIVAEKGGSTLIDLYPNEQSKNNIAMMLTLNNNGDIDGGFRSVKTNHKALSFREKYIDVNKEDYLEKLENKYNGLEISDYTVKNDLDLSKPVMESYKFTKESQADIIGDKIYFSPLFFLRTSENPFKIEKREFPVDFGYPSNTSYRVIITIPEGYKIESLPEPGVFTLPDNLGMFKYNITAQSNKVQLAVETQISTSIISPIYYDALKAYFSKLVEKEAEQIVLTKG